MRRKRLLGKLGLFLAAIAFTGVFFINWCDLVYQCGCTFLWAGASAQCNVHNADPPHCPWCVSSAGAAGALGFTLLAQAFVVWRPGALSLLRIMGAFLVSPAAAIAAGIILGVSTGYW